MKSVPRVLVVDNCKPGDSGLAGLLKSSRYACEVEVCGGDLEKALIRIQNEPWTCIFLDAGTNAHERLTWLKRVRAMGINHYIVATTDSVDENTPDLLITSGASDYIAKNEINEVNIGWIIRNSIRTSLIEKARTNAIHALKEQDSRLAESQRLAKIGNWEWDTNDAIYWSDEVFSILDLKKESTVPSVDKYLEFVHPEDRELIHQILATAKQGVAFNVDHRLVTTEHTKYVHVNGFITRDHAGNFLKLIGTIQDITARKLAEQDVLKAREIAEDSLKVREVFLANMSHEIRTPMNAIIGFTQLLYESNLSPEQKSFVDAINFSGDNLLVIINEILDLSKIQSGKMTLEKIDFNMNDLLKGISNTLRRKAHEKGLQFICDVDDVPQNIKGDPVKLNQVLTNLIGNAIKFTESGYVRLHVSCDTGSGDKLNFHFSVEDTGIGIPQEKQKEVFESFVQASSDMTRKYGGVGLGLTIVKSIVELKGGSISVDSAVGRGSIFRVHLPFEKAGQEVTEVSDPQPDDSIPLHLLKRASILVVEDNHVNQLLVKRVLDKTGCTTDVVSNGLEAINSLKAGKYDLILMDIQMPEMDGYAATKYIRTELKPPLSETPIIAMTAHAFPSEVEKCASIGMDDYLSKPFKQELLYSKIIKHLRKSNNLGIISLHKSRKKENKSFSIDLGALYEICEDDNGFVDDLIRMYEKQTPEFVEKLGHAIKQHEWEVIQSVCHQIHSSYGIVDSHELNDALSEISIIVKQKSSEEISRLTSLLNIVIAIIVAIPGELRRSILKTG
jgi:signal transduction histidine kinase/DNA-binding response OmpR family regulator